MRRLALVPVVVLLTACQALPFGPPSDALLVSVTGKGGECPEGMCEWRQDLYRDARIVASDGTTRQADPDLVARVAAGIATADWDAILARPFTGECPTAFDGLELTYTFPVAGESVVVASCTVQIDEAQEPFASIDQALFTRGG